MAMVELGDFGRVQTEGNGEAFIESRYCLASSIFIISNTETLGDQRSNISGPFWADG